MIATFLSALVSVLLAHYAYIAPDIILSSVASVLVIMIAYGTFVNNIKKD